MHEIYTENKDYLKSNASQTRQIVVHKARNGCDVRIQFQENNYLSKGDSVTLVIRKQNRQSNSLQVSSFHFINFFYMRFCIHVISEPIKQNNRYGVLLLL